MDKMLKSIHIGTSGWHYDHWKGSFYPEDLAEDGLLEYYSGRFSTVEINNTFYQLPSDDTVNTWKAAAGDDFVFSVKASRYITHMKKLKDPGDALKRFFHCIAPLGDRMGPVLFQLPPRWRRDAGRLEDFLEMLPPENRYAFEFRDRSWLDEDVFRILREHGAALCIYDLAGFTSPGEVTAGHVYVRLHGPDGAYRGSYDPQTLSGWIGAFSSWASQGREVYCYFDNDQEGNAVADAIAMRGMIS